MRLVFHFFFFSFLSLSVFAQSSSVYNEWTSTIGDKIAALEKQEQTPDVVAQLSQFLVARDELNEISLATSQQQKFEQISANFTAEQDRLNKAIEDFSTQSFPRYNTLDNDALALAIEEQTRRVDQLQIQRRDYRAERDNIDKVVKEYDSRLSNLEKELDKANRELVRHSDITQNEGLFAAIHAAYYQSLIDSFKAEYQSASNRFVLNELNQELTSLELEARQAYLNNLTRTLRERETQLVEPDTEGDGEQEVIESDSTQPDVIRNLLNENQRTQQFIAVTQSQTQQIRTQQNETKREQQTIDKTRSEFDQIAQWLQLSPAFSETFRTRVAQLPSPAPTLTLEKEIAQSQISKFEYQQRLNAVTELPQPTDDSGLSEEEINSRTQLRQERTKLLQDAIAKVDELIFEQATLQLLYEELNTDLSSLKEQAEKQLFWAPNVSPASKSLLPALGDNLVWFFHPQNWAMLFPLIINSDITLLAFTALVILTTLVVLSRAKKRWHAYLERSVTKIGKVTQDSIRFSYLNVLCCFLLAWPIAFLFSVVGYVFESGWQYPFWHHFGQAMTIPMSLVVFFFIRELVRPNGLLIAHFGWDEDNVNQAFRLFRRLIMFYVPLTIIQLFAQFYSDSDVNATIGRLAFIANNLSISFFLYRMWQLKLPLTYGNLPKGKIHFGHHIFWGSLTVLPQVLSYTALRGYLGASQTVMSHLETSAFLGVISLLIYFLVKRYMLIQKRRLAFERAKAKRLEILMQRQAETEEGDTAVHRDPQIEIEDVEIDLDKISAQSLRLLRSLLFIVYLIGLTVFWADLYQASALLQDVVLWDGANTVQGLNELSSITLRSIVLAILTLVLTLILSRDAPAAMELLILQHLSLSPGTGYAITTLTRYIIITTGILVGSAYVGFDWSKMQWLVAALGVGLGFGLQEIFANFISGLILLFERPIRIGDTVTIRDLTGVVGKIKTRATTIVDWDRKEVIVPNKAFVTEQFVNWSLSDAITRVKIAISVSYVADSDFVTELLFEAAEECELVLDNPAPEVFFLGLTANTQEFEVRAYAAETGHRLTLTHDLYTKIKSRFVKHGIELAPPQLQVNIARNEHQKRPKYSGAKATRRHYAAD
uniref:miniconductance mechanosensitive channel MscM n=1 Tax=Thaumasiovibrio occultus TaxID=1891184 RepID=UPI000B36415B|nr:miniconductance mechanosensitive channel MscM [Thaumasiovibrio occultus]